MKGHDRESLDEVIDRVARDLTAARVESGLGSRLRPRLGVTGWTLTPWPVSPSVAALLIVVAAAGAFVGSRWLHPTDGTPARVDSGLPAPVAPPADRADLDETGDATAPQLTTDTGTAGPVARLLEYQLRESGIAALEAPVVAAPMDLALGALSVAPVTLDELTLTDIAVAELLTADDDPEKESP